MGWRYRKSITLLPGVRVNFGRNSTSLSLGARGFHTTYSSTGKVTRSIGIPGTGLSYVDTSNSNHTHAGSRRSPIARSGDHEIETAQEVLNQSNHIDLPNASKFLDAIKEIYLTADTPINWHEIMASDSGQITGWDYYKSHAEDILNGNIDTYLSVISDLNPLNDLIQYGSQFEFGTEDPRMMAVHFHVNSDSVLHGAKALPNEQYNDLLEDYVYGCMIRIARDIFALLPVRHIVVDAADNQAEIASIDFMRKEFSELDFETLDPSDTIQQFKNSTNFSIERGFLPITPLDEAI